MLHGSLYLFVSFQFLIYKARYEASQKNAIKLAHDNHPESEMRELLIFI